jgi:hypothetical protein
LDHLSLSSVGRATNNYAHPPLSPTKRNVYELSSVVVNPDVLLSVIAVDGLPSVMLQTPRSHLADTGSYTDQPNGGRSAHSTTAAGFVRRPVTPDYTEV